MLPEEPHANPSPDPTIQEDGELLTESRFTLQTPHEFRDDFVRAVQNATTEVALESMQFELNDDTQPIYDSMLEAKERGVEDVSFRFEPRVALRHMRARKADDGEWSETYFLVGHTVFAKGDKPLLKDAQAERLQLVEKMKVNGVLDESVTRTLQGPDHVKMAFADDVAWVGTMGFRGMDFEMSNFMIKVTDPEAVAALKRAYRQPNDEPASPNLIIPIESEHSDFKTEVILDTGTKRESAIYQRGVEMVASLEPGDEVTLINQWPPVEGKMGKLVYGKFLSSLQSKTKLGTCATWLMSPGEDLHPIRRAAGYLQRKAKEMEADDPNLSVVNLPRRTHAKCILIKRADGRREVLLGSHNSTWWTSVIGNRELSIWSDDPEIVDQAEAFLAGVQNEES